MDRKAGTYRQRITLQRAVNGTGEWEDVATVWARVEALGVMAYVDRAGKEQKITHLFDIRYRSDIDTRLRVLYRGRIYRIAAVNNVGERMAELTLQAEELPQLLDTIAVKRKERVRDERNIVSTIELPLRTVPAHIVEVLEEWGQAGHDPVSWKKTATVFVALGEDVRAGDTITLSPYGDFFVTLARPTPHFLQLVAIQERRGAE